MVSVISPVSGMRAKPSDPWPSAPLTAVPKGGGIIPEGHLGCLRNGLWGSGWPGRPGKHGACSPEPASFAHGQPPVLMDHAPLSISVRSWVSAQRGGCVCCGPAND